MVLPGFVSALPHDVYAIDTGLARPGFDAAYAIVHRGRAAFVDTGPAPAVPRLLSALQALGRTVECVDWVIVTHVHLDHAGGAGALMKALPRARLLVHPRGARHMVDPSKLSAGALAVYGQAYMDRHFGSLTPVPEARVEVSSDGQTLDLAGRSLRLIHTPGHALHHHCVWDERSGGWFTGDTFGLSYREFDVSGRAWSLPSSTPVQFDPQALAASMARLLAFRPDCMYLTHFGRVQDVTRLAEQQLQLLAHVVELGRSLGDATDRQAALERGLLSLYRAQLRDHGCMLSDARIEALLAQDVRLNALGMGVWLDRAHA